MSRTNSCPYCQQVMQVAEMACGGCGVAIRAEFATSRLAGLPLEHQRFIELFVLAGGSLKAIAQHTGVSYPTIRSRLDRVMECLQATIESGPPTAGEPTTPLGLSERAGAEVVKSV